MNGQEKTAFYQLGRSMRTSISSEFDGPRISHRFLQTVSKGVAPRIRSQESRLKTIMNDTEKQIVSRFLGRIGSEGGKARAAKGRFIVKRLIGIQAAGFPKFVARDPLTR